MERRRNARMGETGYPRENPLTSVIVRHDSHMRKSRCDPAGNRTRVIDAAVECGAFHVANERGFRNRLQGALGCEWVALKCGIIGVATIRCRPEERAHVYLGGPDTQLPGTLPSPSPYPPTTHPCSGGHVTRGSIDLAWLLIMFSLNPLPSLRKITPKPCLTSAFCLTGAGETGVPRENPPTNGIVRHDSHLRKSGGDRAIHSATAAPSVEMLCISQLGCECWGGYSVPRNREPLNWTLAVANRVRTTSFFYPSPRHLELTQPDFLYHRPASQSERAEALISPIQTILR
ncbi:hypothetical protein PR048_030169 [Dryococelus australis]|uniref:Uncharacterized protein n=1 Tax=Dryococelus australis TaxID=614101 RepID=A0ABQ9G861_9NEOP|nr:hypothetical protein PR048_030169 [Dryococelus australis]